MPASFAIGLFCEDVRDEVAGTQSIVGILPDNMAIPSVPVALPRLVLYLRLMLDPASDPGAISASLDFPNGETRQVVSIDADATEDACKAARESGAPYAGMVTVVAMQQFTVIAAGRLVAMVRIGGQERVCAALNFQVLPASSTAPLPQSADAPRPKGP